VLLLLLCAVMVSKGQTQPYGQIDIADLRLTTCDFEKDASAMVLFDKTDVSTVDDQTVIVRHKRIKFLNNKGFDAADVVLAYRGKNHLEKITDVEAQTINLDGDVIKYLPVDNALIYKQAADKNTKTIKFSFPGVKAGSIVEFAYKLNIDFPGAIPDWNFQGRLPVRYSEFNADISRGFSFKIATRVSGEFSRQVKERIRGSVEDSIGTHYGWAIKNEESFKEEPYTTCAADNLQSIRFYLFKTPFANYSQHVKTWARLASVQLSDGDFREQLTRNLSDADNLLGQAKQLKTDEEKIALIFNGIKNVMKWDGYRNWDTYDGVKKAWEKKQGNNTEINLILYNFLRMAGIKSALLYVSTRDNGKVDLGMPDMDEFNNLVLSVTTTAKKTYVLDASSKLNTYNIMPFSLLNNNALKLDLASETFELSALKNEMPSRQAVFVNAQVKPDGKLEGNTHITSFSYNRIKNTDSYKTLGEEKYKDALRDKDNNLKILSLQRENVESDTLPLIESFEFKQDLTSSDDKYIFINPNLFTGFRTNPFLSEKRKSTIDFGNLNLYSIKGLYKCPTGYKTESIPKPVSLSMPDNSISFKRIVSEEDGSILVNYSISFKKAIFTTDEYPGIRDFYKKMFEMLNEQIVLKKE